LFSFLIFLGCSEKLPSEVTFFENYDMNSGKYKILIYGSEGEWIEGYRDFYIDDIQTLEKIKKQWVFRKKSEVMSCGYSYILYLVDENTVLKNESINIACEYMTGWIKFPKEYLTEHKSSFKRMTEENKAEFQKKYFKK